MNHVLRDAAGRFTPIGLDELGDAALMQRVDRKFVLPVEQLRDLLVNCVNEYRMLEVGGVRLNRYSTRYYDTPGLGLYHAHHAGRAPRTKVRVREYVDSGVRYAEVKQRSNTDRTTKTRVPLNGNVNRPMAALRTLPEFAGAGVGTGDDLCEVLEVAYTRITLVHHSLAERVTVDVDLTVSTGARVAAYPTLAFIEVKQPHITASPIVDALRSRGAPRGSISKYCLGVVALIDGAKKNRFKQDVAQLDRAANRGVAYVA